MWLKIKVWLKGANDFLTAHPVIKNLLDGFGKCVLGATIAYVGPILDPKDAVELTTGGLGVAVMGAVKAWLQNNHDVILAQVQDVTEKVLTGSSVALIAGDQTTSSKLTPIDVSVPKSAPVNGVRDSSNSVQPPRP